MTARCAGGDGPASAAGRGRLRVRRSLPVVEFIPVEVAADERAEIARVAARLLADEPALAAADVFGPRVTAGVGPGPALLFEDHSGTAFAERRGDSLLEYRTLFLADEGDLMVVGGRRDPAFESYCSRLLGRGQVDVVRARTTPVAGPVPLAVRCANDPAIMARAVAMARDHGNLTLVTYMGTGHVWRLAGAIADRSGGRVRVASPLPRLGRRVNHKLWFARRVFEVLGRRALPSTFSAFGPAALAGRVLALARRHERVVIKVPDSAGSEGNLVLDADGLRDLSIAELRLRLMRLMIALGWRHTYPLAVGIWDCPTLDSPSVQMWIPDRRDGPPVVQGIFSQTVTGTAAEFIGAAPSDLPFEWQSRMAREASILACLLQELGYFGPCGFDAVLAGRDLGAAELHWIECNGRWGGVSIPLALANRLVGDWRRRPFVVVQRTGLQGAPFESFAALLAALEDRLYDRVDAAAGAVVLTPTRMVAGVGIHVMVLAATAPRAKAEAEALTAYLLGDGGRPAGPTTGPRAP